MSSLPQCKIGQKDLRLLSLSMIKPKPKEAKDYARRHDQDPATALGQDYLKAVEGIREGYEDFKAGRIQPAEKVFEELCEKHGLPR